MEDLKHRHFGLKFILILIGMILIAGVVGLSIIRDRIVNWPQYQVSVTGQGKISYEPDVANITLGVQIDKVAKADEALKQLNEKINTIIAAVKSQGISAENIKTQNYSLMPQYDYTNGVSTSSGFSANQQLVVKIENIKDNPNKTSKVIEEASKAGSNQVIGITFDVSNLDELKQQARLLAITDAKKKAGSLAQAAGIELGSIIGWWENLLQSPASDKSYYGYSAGMGGGAPMVPGGSQDILLEISLNYQVKIK